MSRNWMKIAMIIVSLVFIATLFGWKLVDANHFSNKVTNEWASLVQRVNLMEEMEIQSNQVEWVIKEILYQTQEEQTHQNYLANLKNHIESMFVNYRVEKENLATVEKYKMKWTDNWGEGDYTILSYKKGKTYFIELCYQYRYTNDTNLSQKKYMEKIIRETSCFFSVNATIFSCVEGLSSDKLVEALREKSNYILKFLYAQNITGIDEGTFASYTAYTGQWGNTFSSAEKKINLQIAYRVGDQQTNWFFGTPMILGEW